MYPHAYLGMHTYMDTYICTYTHAYIHMIHTCMHAYIRTDTYPAFIRLLQLHAHVSNHDTLTAFLTIIHVQLHSRITGLKFLVCTEVLFQESVVITLKKRMKTCYTKSVTDVNNFENCSSIQRLWPELGLGNELCFHWWGGWLGLYVCVCVCICACANEWRLGCRCMWVMSTHIHRHVRWFINTYTYTHIHT